MNLPAPRGGVLHPTANQLAPPHRFEILDVRTAAGVQRAIKDMYVRGAGLIGAAAAFGMYLAALEAGDRSFEQDVLRAAEALKATRPAASNLAWAVNRMLARLTGCEAARLNAAEKRDAARRTAQAVADQDADYCKHIGMYGLDIIKAVAERKKARYGASAPPVHILTHCNAGWLAFVDYGSALSPVYAAFDAGINVVPFYVALPSSTFDFAMREGIEIPIEERDASEVRFVSGKTADGSIETVQICPDETPARNWGFDVTPARYIRGFITERGVCDASEKGILSLYPEYAGALP